MNYLKQILSLNQIQLNNPLSQGQFMLYHALLDINNQCAWKEWFEVANLRLQAYTGLTRQGIVKCRNELRQRGYIDFKTNGTKASSYKIFSLYDSNSLQAGLQDSLQAGLQVGCQVVDKLVDEQLSSSLQVGCTLNKQNKTKLNESKEKVEKEKPTEENTPTHEKKKKTSTSKAKKEAKIKYAENVEMTEAEYQRLLKDNNNDAELVKACISKLDNYKGSSGKKYKSDYRAILSWVLDDQKQRLLKQGAKFKQTSAKDVSYDISKAERKMQQARIVYRGKV